MTEQEAIKILSLDEKEKKLLKNLTPVYEVAIKALKEIQQYRAIGTQEELQDMKNNYFEALSDWRQYRKIGTLEECRAAVEKQTANKIVRVKLRQSEWGSEYRCPVCESDLIKTVFFNEDGTEPDEKISWCSGCGQRLDWSDES